MGPNASPDRWAVLRPIVEAALELPPGERAAFLDRSCGHDDGLRVEAERLVEACQRAGESTSFLAGPAAAFAGPAIADLAERARGLDSPRDVVSTPPRSSDASGVHEGSVGIALGDRYTVERELGRGGMATVYLASDRRHGRRVAVKVLRPDLGASLSAERFLREIRVTAGLTHPHILPLHDSGQVAGALYYVMPFVDGESLRERLRRETRLSPGVVASLMREVASALDYAHRHGVIHRDIKPENVLLADGHAVVADFGIAKAIATARDSAHHRDSALGAPGLGGGGAGPSAESRVTMTDVSMASLTALGVSLGTPGYMAPEQALGDTGTDHRADLYALGVVAYEALAGAHPFGTRALQAMVAAHLGEAPVPIAARCRDVPPALAALVMHLLEKDPTRRPASAAAVLRALDAAAATSGERPGPASVVASAGPQRRRRSVALAVGAGALVLVGLGGYTAWRRSRAMAGGASAATARPVTADASRVPSIAVLPFANMSDARADEHFSDGLTDELIGALGKLEGLKVAGRTSVFSLKGKGLGTRAIADTLGVTTVLDGSVRRDGDRLRVSAQLVSAADNSVLWTETYQRRLEDVFAVQDEVVQAIVAALRVKLGSVRDGALVRRSTDDPTAYDLYLKGRYFLNTRSGRDGIVQAIQAFEGAIARDSAFARAYAGLSDARARLAVFGYARAHDEFALAKAAARRALALDSTLAEGHAALAHALYVYDFDPAAAEREFRRAIALDPGGAATRMVFAIQLQSQRRFDEAVAQLDTARESEPLAAFVPNVLGRVYVNAGRPDDAIRALREAIDLNPQLDLAYQQLGHAYLLKGMHREAIAALRRAAQLSGPRDSAQLAYAYAVAGQREEARRILRSLLDPPRRHHIPFHLAMAYVGLGDADEAFRWLERAFEERASFMDGVKITAAFEPLHGDPRWGALLRRMGQRR